MVLLGKLKNSMKLKLLTLVGLLSLAASSQALTLKEAYNSALTHDLTYSRAGAVLEQANADANAKYSAVLPNVALSYTWGLSRNLSVAKDASALLGGQVQTSNIALSLSQNLFNLPAFYSLSIAKKQKIQAQINYVIAQQDLMQRVITGYTNLLKANDALNLAISQADYNNKVFNSAKVRYNHGLISQVDYNTAEANYLQSQASLEQAKAKLNSEINSYRLVVGHDADLSSLQDIRKNANLNVDYQPLAVTPANVANNLSLKALAMTKAIAKDGASVGLAAVFPTINLQLRVANNSQNTTQFGMKGWGEAHKLDRLQAGVTFSLPIFTGGKIYNGVKSSQAQYNQASVAYDLAFQQTQSAMETNLAAIESSKKVIRSLTLGAQAAEKAYNSRVAAYDTGYASITDVVSASTNFYNVTNNLNAAKYGYISAIVQQKILEGNLSENDLDLLDKVFTNKVKLQSVK